MIKSCDEQFPPIRKMFRGLERIGILFFSDFRFFFTAKLTEYLNEYFARISTFPSGYLARIRIFKEKKRKKKPKKKKKKSKTNIITPTFSYQPNSHQKTNAMFQKKKKKKKKSKFFSEIFFFDLNFFSFSFSFFSFFFENPYTCNIAGRKGMYLENMSLEKKTNPSAKLLQRKIGRTDFFLK